jgi:TPR repeat protein
VDDAPFPHWAPLGGPPKSQPEVLRVLVRCGQRDGRACLAAGVAYSEGHGVPKDAKEADRFERIALTLLGKHCEQRDALACIDLAAMYRRGIIVQRSDDKANLLVARAHELCKIHRGEGCGELAH